MPYTASLVTADNENLKMQFLKMSSDLFVYVKHGCISGSELLFVTNKVKKECYFNKTRQ